MSAVLTETHRPTVVERTPEQCRIAGIVAEFRRDIERLGGVTDFQHGLAVGRLIAARCTDSAPLDFIERAIRQVNKLATQSHGELA